MNPTLFLMAAALAVPPQMGQRVDEFALVDQHGKSRSLAEFKEDQIVVLAFLGTECPLAKLYGPRLSAMHEEYQSRGVAFIGINSNAQDSEDEIAAYVQQHQIGFPVLKDSEHRVADRMKAKRTPEVFVLDRDRMVRYWGRIDDQFGVGYARDKPTSHELRNAIGSLLADRQVEPSWVESVGCHIGRAREAKADAEVTYSGQVARILQKHCVECHREGEIGPFALSDYHEVSGWAETIVEVIDDGRMPPWHASPQFGSFANARQMSDEERQTIRDWVDSGAPEGDPAELPAERNYVSGWRLPQSPDLTIAMDSSPFTVAADGTIEYQYFVVDPGFEEDRWVSAAEVIPGNRSVVHHAIVFIRPPGQVSRNGLGWLSAYVPGQTSTALPDGRAILVPAGSKFVFQMHYTPVGSEQSDLTKVGLVFADPSDVRERVVTLIALNRDFEIPPHAHNKRVTTWLDDFPENAKLLAMAPHMHVRGKAFRFVLHQGEREEVLLDVPNYDFNWQHSYQLAEPMELHDDMRIECVAHFDNSADNVVNPDPDEWVRWGDQTWQEMVVGYFGVAVPRDQDVDAATQSQQSRRNRKLRAEQTAERMLNRFDKNQDGVIGRKEVPESFRVFAFGKFDHDGDGRITREEVQRQAFRTRSK